MNGLTSKTLSDRFNKPLDVHNIETRFAKIIIYVYLILEQTIWKKALAILSKLFEQTTTRS